MQPSHIYTLALSCLDRGYCVPDIFHALHPPRIPHKSFLISCVVVKGMLGCLQADAIEADQTRHQRRPVQLLVSGLND